MNGAVSYFGCIGNDAAGQQVVAAVNACGVDGKFEVSEEEPTSTCAVVVVG